MIWFSVTLNATKEQTPKYEKLYANYAPHFNFGTFERCDKQTNNID